MNRRIVSTIAAMALCVVLVCLGDIPVKTAQPSMKTVLGEDRPTTQTLARYDRLNLDIIRIEAQIRELLRKRQDLIREKEGLARAIVGGPKMEIQLSTDTLQTTRTTSGKKGD